MRTNFRRWVTTDEWRNAQGLFKLMFKLRFDTKNSWLSHAYNFIIARYNYFKSV